MNEPERRGRDPEDPNRDAQQPAGDSAQGPNLILIYSLIALALAAAIAIAAMFVMPLYRGR